MRVAFTGGRDFKGGHETDLILDKLMVDIPITEVLVGEAKGLDSFVQDWASERGIPFEVYSAEWEIYGKAAGPIRNVQMLRDAEVLVKFPGGRGTADCYVKAEIMGIETIIVDDGIWRK